MGEYVMAECIENGPLASSLMEAARSFGNYDLGGALADLVDNSIKATSSVVEITCLWNDGQPVITVRDDGYGMSKAELHSAMRLVSINPRAERAPEDLGRFGLGLKTASFSQCRRLSVFSNRKGKTAGARWDLDDLRDKFLMQIPPPEEQKEAVSEFLGKSDGTLVRWEKLDRLTEGGQAGENEFNAAIIAAKRHLAIVFHRFLEGEGRRKKLRLVLNNDEVPPFDPFNKKRDATQALAREVIPYKGKRIQVQPYILPHHSKVSQREYEALSGAEGYLRNQGFYVYRQKRLIIHGTWFRLARHGELSKLARVQVDIPNSLDSEWRINVDKSDAQLPARVKTRLKQVIERIRGTSTRVYTARGSRVGQPGITTVWKRRAFHGQVRYVVNREHPLVEQVLQKEEAAGFKGILDLIETNLPVESLYADLGESPRDVVQAETDTDALFEATRTIISIFLDAGMNADQVREKVRAIEPFASNWPQIKGLVDQSVRVKE